MCRLYIEEFVQAGLAPIKWKDRSGISTEFLTPADDEG
jgi:hypothetical protein